MRKYAYIIILALIASAVYFTSCERIPKEMMDTIMPDAEPVEEMVEPEPPEETTTEEQVEPPEMVETPAETTTEEGLGIFDCAVLPGHGLRAEAFYPGTVLSRLPDFDTLTPFLVWSVACIDVPSRRYEEGFPALGLEILENFAIRMRGQIEIETAGTYNFKTSSDDGSQLYINDALIVDNDGLHGFASATGSVMLEAGFHDVELQYFQGPRFYIGLQWFWQPPGAAEAIVPPEVLYPPGAEEIPEPEDM